MKKFFHQHIYFFIYIAIALVISLAAGLLLELFDLPDGFFYVALGQYVFTGLQAPISPFNLVIPQTLFAPVYGLFSYPFMIMHWPLGLILLPAAQLFLYFLSGWFVYQILLMFLPKKWSIAGLVLFLIFPFGLVYATVLMSETLGVFFVSLYTLFLVGFLKKKKWAHPSILFFISCITGLTRYPFILLTLFSGFLWIQQLKATSLKTFKLVHLLPFFVGVSCIAVWINFNHTIHGHWILTSYTGRHLFNNVVHSAHLTPPSDNPSWKEFLSRLPDKSHIYDPEWEVQPWFAPDFRKGKITEIDMDRIFLAFSIHAITSHPLEYVVHVVKTVYGNITTAPFHVGILPQLGVTDPSCPTCVKHVCRISWNTNSCKEFINIPLIHHIWGNLILLWISLYPQVTLLLFILAGIGVLVGILKKNLVITIMSGIFLFFMTAQAAAQQIEGRYVIPLYPIYVTLVIYGLNAIWTRIHKK